MALRGAAAFIGTIETLEDFFLNFFRYSFSGIGYGKHRFSVNVSCRNTNMPSGRGIMESVVKQDRKELLYLLPVSVICDIFGNVCFEGNPVLISNALEGKGNAHKGLGKRKRAEMVRKCRIPDTCKGEQLVDQKAHTVGLRTDVLKLFIAADFTLQQIHIGTDDGKPRF